MPQPFDPKRDWENLHSQIVGLGEHSSRKSYFPELQKRLRELEEEVKRRELVEEELRMKNRMFEDEIAQRQKAEINASNERDIAHAIFEAAPVGMMIINESCRVIDANKAMEDICGKKPESILNLVPGQVLNCAYKREDNPECGQSFECASCNLRQMIRGVIKSREACYGIETHQMIRHGADTEDAWFKISVEPIFVKNQSCAIIVIDDVTEQHQMQDDLLRTHKLESLGVLAGGIAHDFNNMLTGVIANLSLAHTKTDDQNIRKLLKRSLDAADQATNLTRQLMTFAKGGAPIKKLASIIDIVSDSANFALRGANVACELIVADNIWVVEVDTGQLSQVISNLVINADQAMPEGGTLRISISNLQLNTSFHGLNPGRYVTITIEDEGIGIPGEYLRKVFDPYFTTKQTGSGLGLASVHSIITRHGGQIEVRSEVGRGTVFKLYIPASDQSFVLQENTSIQVLHGSGKILIMDDEEYIREVAVDMLEMLGYECVACENGQQAIELYRAAMASGSPFVAVIMDLTIPGGLGGVDALANIRQIDPAVRGIVASGYSNDPVVASHNEYGFLAAVNKPYSLSQMAEAINRVIKISVESS